ncbi:spore cortex biosynthesis protein YabQ [uncultured Acetatifactor sp.]|uniref:spore cortex biosynthesis protein YabQ n=1 Tax=uncultured Acetatifactor sp. TaxID=1671927 RepID=UPI002625ED74|nr:spore cortex biosynthesis protein YabQ [uncultured Acetatifactor sp.]
MVSENEFLLHALCMGAFITFLYDCLRILRRVLPHGGFLVSLEDLVFWIYCAEQVFLLMYRESNGTLRWFAVLGALAGMFFYRKLFSPLFVKYISVLLSRVLSLAGKVLQWMLRPFSYAGRKTGSALGKAGGRFRRRMKKIRRAIKMRLTFFLKLFKMNLKA